MYVYVYGQFHESCELEIKFRIKTSPALSSLE